MRRPEMVLQTVAATVTHFFRAVESGAHVPFPVCDFQPARAAVAGETHHGRGACATGASYPGEDGAFV